MIPSSAVNKFLRAPRDDLGRYKRMSDAELERVADSLPVRPPIWRKLQRDQRVLLAAVATHKRLGAWADTGVGKTVFSIAAARYFRKALVARRSLVLVPGNINLAEWQSERDLHSRTTSMQLLTDSSKNKWSQLRGDDPTLTVATYGGLVRMVCRSKVVVTVAENKLLEATLSERRQSKERKQEYLYRLLNAAADMDRRALDELEADPDVRAWLVSATRAGECGDELPGFRDKALETVLDPHPELVGELCETFGGLVMDESSADQAVQYHDSLAWRVCRKLSLAARVRVAMSATPFGRDPTPLWAQMYLVDHGEALGDTLGLFRRAFFSESENQWGGRDYEFREKMSRELHRLLAHSSITIEADEASLPPVVRRVRSIKLPHDAADYSRMARDAILDAKGNYQETRNSFIRLRQISSGFLGYTDDESGAKAKFVFEENPKLESLISKVQQVAPKYKMIVAHEFIYSGDRICAELERIGVGFARVRSGKQRDVDDALRRIKTDDNCRVLVISNRMVQGPNLQVCKYLECFESPIDPKARKQLERRIERQHSRHSKVFITDYVAEGTYDRKILSHLKDGRNLFEAIIKGRGKL